MRPRLVAAVCAIAALAAACTGGGAAERFDADGGAAATPSAITNAQRAEVTKALAKAPTARLHAGVDSAEGIPVVYCRGSDCSGLDAKPKRYLKSSTDGFVTFSVGRAPQAAEVALLRRGDDEPAVVRLNPGTLMCLCEMPPPGRYDVELVVTWKDAKARWIFGLGVAAGA